MIREYVSKDWITTNEQYRSRAEKAGVLFID